MTAAKKAMTAKKTRNQKRIGKVEERRLAGSSDGLPN